jgi:MFS family permease
VIIVFLTTGVRFTVGPFLKPIVSDLGLDRGSFSLVISLSLFLYGAFMPLVGGLVDRVGARLVCAGGGVLLAGSLALTARMTSYWEFLLYFGVLSSLGLAATGHLPRSPGGSGVGHVAGWRALRRHRGLRRGLRGDGRAAALRRRAERGRASGPAQAEPRGRAGRAPTRGVSRRRRPVSDNRHVMREPPSRDVSLLAE